MLAKTSHLAEAPQAQVNRVKVNLHSVGQDLTLLLSPLGTDKQSRHPTDTGKQSINASSLCWPRLHISVQAPQAQVSRVEVNVQGIFFNWSPHKFSKYKYLYNLWHLEKL